MSDKLLEIKDLHVNAGDKEILKGLNLNIKKGEVHVIMGPNGVGKSTLSKVLMGSNDYVVSSGDILADNHSILSMPIDERARLGMFLSFQSPIDIEGVTNSEFLKVAINERREEPIGLYDFISDLEKEFSGEEKIAITFNGKVLTLECLSKNFAIDSQKALEIASKELADKITMKKSFSKLNAECYLRVLDKKANKQDGVFWCFSVLNVDNENYSVIISTTDGKVLAKSK